MSHTIDTEIAENGDRQGFRIPLSERIALRVPEAVAASGIGRTTLFELIGSGKLPSVKRGGCRLILREDLERFLKGEAA